MQEPERSRGVLLGARCRGWLCSLFLAFVLCGLATGLIPEWLCRLVDFAEVRGIEERLLLLGRQRLDSLQSLKHGNAVAPSQAAMVSTFRLLECSLGQLRSISKPLAGHPPLVPHVAK